MLCSLGATRELSGRSLGALWELVAVAGISYFIFDDIASLAGSAERQNVDPTILLDICQGLKSEIHIAVI